MELTMMMPANYAVMDTEEMTYTDGGVSSTQVLCSLFPLYGWYVGVTTARNYRRSAGDNWLTSGVEKLSKDMEKSTNNLIYDVACAFWTSTALCAFPIGTAITALAIMY
jgi:hypothetical protein